jgi:hypothetical protein
MATFAEGRFAQMAEAQHGRRAAPPVYADDVPARRLVRPFEQSSATAFEPGCVPSETGSMPEEGGTRCLCDVYAQASPLRTEEPPPSRQYTTPRISRDLLCVIATRSLSVELLLLNRHH